MSCADFVSRLQEVLDERGQPNQDPALLRHAAHCEACRERLEAHERLLEGLATAAQEWIHAERTHGRRVAEPVRPPGAVGLLRLTAIATATSAALVLSVIWKWPQPQPDLSVRAPAQRLAAGSADRRPAANPLAVASVQTPLGPRVAPGSLPAEDDSANSPSDSPYGTPNVAASWNQGWDAARGISLDGVTLAEHAERLSSLCSTICKSPPLPDSTIPQVEQLTDGIRPLAQPFFSVLQALRISLPGGRSSPPALPRDDTTMLVRVSYVS